MARFDWKIPDHPAWYFPFLDVCYVLLSLILLWHYCSGSFATSSLNKDANILNREKNKRAVIFLCSCNKTINTHVSTIYACVCAALFIAFD